VVVLATVVVDVDAAVVDVAGSVVEDVDRASVEVGDGITLVLVVVLVVAGTSGTAATGGAPALCIWTSLGL
jgi:hypothetical protein